MDALNTQGAAPDASGPTGETILEMRGITKRFGVVTALSDVTFAVKRGEIHAIVGENGAGKSTLMKVLSGVYPHGNYEGEIIYEGKPVAFRSLSDSERLGIVIIHQELALIPLLSIAENIFLGNERAKAGVIDWRRTNQRAAELLARVGLSERPTTRVGDLGMGKQQLVEIAKALSKDVKLLILDEPTSSLNEADSEALLDLLLEFKARGISSILISHKLNEVSKVADEITILRDGEVVTTLDASEGVSEDVVIQAMVGRDLSDRYPPRDLGRPLGETLFEVRNWTAFHPQNADRRSVDDVSFTVRKGEIVGISGLMGAGRTELAMSIFGRTYGRNISGEVMVDGQKVDTSTVRRAINAGLAYVTEDRKQYGLVLDDTIRHNIPLARLEGISSGGIVDNGKEIAVARGYRDRLRIKSSSIAQEAVNLSGGNQQKVVLAKWLFTGPRVLILDEPTRGIDVGAKFEIYTIIHELAAEGRAVVVISSEMPEILGVCDRVYVMNEGRMVGELPVAEASQEKIMGLILRAPRGRAAA